MENVIKADDLFERATGAPLSKDEQPTSSHRLPPIKVASLKIDELINTKIPFYVNLLVELERARELAQQVDGRIIGTGEADFTKGNTVYSLNYEGRIFQLIDVPGIEGDEGKYVNMVQQAVAKAHMIFYVNGTNKKPEKATANKIKHFLRRGTQVCPIINIRGNADSYEFEEDRRSLEAHGGATAALKQTTIVLNEVLGSDVLLTGQCVQGLLAFSSLAMNAKTHRTTIHPSRSKDLVLQQRNYLKHFPSTRAMFDFSQIRTVAKVLHTKLGTFKEDIVESNKTKVRELLRENADNLKKELDDHQKFIATVEPEFRTCRASIAASTERFERIISASRKNLWCDFFNKLSAEFDEIVSENFGNNDVITRKMKRTFKNRQSAITEKMQEQLNEHAYALQEDMNRAMERLIQDVRRVEFLQKKDFGTDGQSTVYRVMDHDTHFDLSEFGSILFNIGSYALSGATIGSPGGPIGAAIGAAIGAVVGMVMSFIDRWTSKESRIRKAQAQVQRQLDDVRDQVMRGLPDELRNLMAPIHKELKAEMLSRVENIFASLTQPITIIEKQIALMKQMQSQLEKMPYGTIRAVQI